MGIASIVTLEPPYQSLKIHADSEIERTYRAHSISKEQETVEFIRSIPSGSVLYDVGANVGSYSLIAGRHGIETYAFEPAPFNFSRLVQNVKLNDLEIHCFPWALSNETGTIGMDFSSEEPGSAEHRITKQGTIPCYRLDDLVEKLNFPIPDAVKIDVDGHELAVIEGGQGIWPQVSAVQVEIDNSLRDWEQILTLLNIGGLRVHTWTRHGSTNISNVLFRR